MRLKNLLLTVAVLAVLSALAYFLQRPAPAASADTRVGQSVADPAAIEKAAKFRLTEQGKSVTLVRDSAGAWRVSSYHDLPADFAKLSRFIGDLSDAKIQRLVTANPERIARLEFKGPSVELLDAADKPLWTLAIGKTAETGGARFIRFGDEPKAYLAGFNAWIDPEPKNWADSQLLNLKPEDIAKLEIGFADGTSLHVSRAKKEDPWTADPTPANEKVKADKIASLLTSLGALRFSDTTEPTDAKFAEARPHSRTAKLTTFDGKTYTVALARKPEEKKLKPPAPSADGKSGPAALGSVADLAKSPTAGGTTSVSSAPADSAKPAEPKPLEPEFETIPAGPVFVTVASSDAAAPVNALMQKRAFQIHDYTFTSLPEKPADLFEPAPPPAPAPKPEEPKPAAPPAR